MDNDALSTTISSSEPEPSTNARPDPPSILDIPFRLPNQNLISLGILSPPSEADLELLLGSWLPTEDVVRAAIRRVNSRQGQAILDRRGGNCAGLAFPNFMPGTDAIRQIMVRLDNPIKRAKYLVPTGARNLAYFPPGTGPDQLDDPTQPLILSEGPKKVLAVARLADTYPDRRFVACGFSGVWGWRGRTSAGNGETAPIQDLDRLNWHNRSVIILYDSDASTNPNVASARDALAAELVRRGASVRLVDLPAITPDKKASVDDLLAHPDFGPAKVLELISSATVFETKKPTGPTIRGAGGVRYEMGPRGTFLVSGEGEDEKRTQLANFSAKIISDVIEDDGSSEQRRRFEIEARLEGLTQRFTTTPQDFLGMNWPAVHLGPRAVVYPTGSARDHLRAAVQLASEAAQERRVHTSLGWRVIDGRYVYLHAGGGLGADGPVPGLDISPPPRLRDFELPAPSTGSQLTDAIRQSLNLLDVAPDRISISLFAAAWRAPLGAVDFSIHLSGQTGQGKSELAALVQRFFGSGMHRENLPASWCSTANYSEALAFHAADAVLVIDDFKPGGSSADIQRAHFQADRVFRSAGNRTGRGRMRSDGSLQIEKPPRAFIVSTGEEVPHGHSLRARLVVLELAPGDVRWDHLTTCQQLASNGVPASTMAAFIQWLAPKMPVQIPRLIESLRPQLSGAGGLHRRIPNNFANLSIGLKYFLDFAVESEAISPAESQATWDRAIAAFNTLAEEQRSQEVQADPVHRYFESLASGLATGKARIDRLDDRISKVLVTAPHPVEIDLMSPEQWAEPLNGFEPPRPGRLIGWTKGPDIYLDPAAAYAVAQQIARDNSEPLPISEQTLRKRLRDQACLVSTDDSRRTLTVRRTFNGVSHNVLHLRPGLLSPRSAADKVDNTVIVAGEQPEMWALMSATEPMPTTKPTSNSSTSAMTCESNVGFVGMSTGEESTSGQLVRAMSACSEKPTLKPTTMPPNGHMPAETGPSNPATQPLIVSAPVQGPDAEGGF